MACDETLEEVHPLCVRSQHNQDDYLLRHDTVWIVTGTVWIGSHVHKQRYVFIDAVQCTHVDFV